LHTDPCLPSDILCLYFVTTIIVECPIGTFGHALLVLFCLYPNVKF
jgi:hypothetical protein